MTLNQCRYNKRIRCFSVQEETANKVPGIVFDRVHRIGCPEYDFFTGQANLRQVVAKFEKNSDREYIRKTGVELNKRQRRYPIMRNLNKDGENRVTLVHDKLYINGTLYYNGTNSTNVKQTQPGQAWNKPIVDMFTLNLRCTDHLTRPHS